ncbi:MAG: phytoene/squalene synthase family protein [Prolixibacteraceae bacterium]
MMQLYDKNAFDCSKITANNYSTSFSMGIRLFKQKYRPAIYAIYGYVRFADEIVDTFHGYNKKLLLDNLKQQTWLAIDSGLCTNPILHSFQKVVNDYNIDREYIEAFLHSMEMDLTYKTFNEQEIKEYIYGSAEVVGLMCLKIFYKNREDEFNELIYPARKLGEAFQKVNFLRDIRADYMDKQRIYFPGIKFENFTEVQKRSIEDDIWYDFDQALPGIKKLHNGVRPGVYLAYRYYLELLRKIRQTSPEKIMKQRYHVSDSRKVRLLAESLIGYRFGKY